jgi:hypothetical protein
MPALRRPLPLWIGATSLLVVPIFALWGGRLAAAIPPRLELVEALRSGIAQDLARVPGISYAVGDEILRSIP